jgi:hypothetical protein
MSDETTCRSCGAQLAEDQRYCLNCGERRGEPRIDFRQFEAPPVQPPSEVTPTAPAEEKKPERDYTPLAAVGGIAVLGVMLLIGVLIGKGDSGGTATTPAPVVVQGGEAATGKTASNEGAGEAKAEAKQAKSKGSGKGSGSVKGGSANTGSAPVASDETLEQLQEGTPEEKAEQSANLPDEVATGGAPPPEDNKAPGGGSKGTAIE